MNAVINHPVRPRESQVPAKGKALVADEDPGARLLLESALQANGYLVSHAAQGAEAIERFASERPTIVFVDVGLPQVGGYEAVKRIRDRADGQSVTIIFLAAAGEQAKLAEFIDVGGDDFLAKPLRRGALEFKISALARFQEMRRQLSGLYSRMKQEESMAQSVLRDAVLTGNVAMDRISSLLRPAQVLSGDVLLSAYTPSGDLNVIFGDFTGHGLAATMGALPTSEVFRAMTNKGFSPQQILAGINSKLHDMIPNGMFLAVLLVSIKRSLKHLTICNCGMPDSLLLEQGTGRLIDRFQSNRLPLGITLDLDFQATTRYVELHGGERILLVSDGVLEARNSRNERFGHVGLERAIARGAGGADFLAGIVEELDDFCGDAAQEDDISMAEIPCLPDILQDWEGFPASPAEWAGGVRDETVADDQLEFSLTLNGRRLRQTDPIPLVINHVQEIEGLHSYRRTLFTIVTELYANALDHGVLGLDSNLKRSSEGFTRYFTEREKRLRKLDTGSITIRVKSCGNAQGGRITINLTDSGEGFDFTALECDNMPSRTRFSGRGILLLKELCESLRFKAPGNQVEAVFSWSTGPSG